MPPTDLSPMSRVRDELQAALEQHDAEHHPGDPCVLSRIDAVAYLAHSLGMSKHHTLKFVELLADYNRHCPGRGCSHNGHGEGPGHVT